MTTTGKRNILSAARTLFSEKGFEGASLRDISKRAHVNVAMIAYYFGCKEDLYLSCLTDFAHEQVAIIQSILQTPKDKNDFVAKLNALIASMMDKYEVDAPMVKILIRELQADNKRRGRQHAGLATPLFGVVRNYFQQAIDAGIISSDKSADLIAIVFLGALSNPIQTEAPLKRAIGMGMRDREFRNNYSKHLIDIFINGVIA